MTGRDPHEMASNPHNRFYLETKAGRSGHLLLQGVPGIAIGEQINIRL